MDLNRNYLYNILENYLIHHYHHLLIRVYPIMQQTLIIFVLVTLYKTTIYIIQGVIGELPHTLFYWLTAFVSAILWPWMFILLLALITSERTITLGE